MGSLLAAECYKIVRRPMTWIALVILLAIMATLRGLLIALSFVPLPAAGPQGVTSTLFVDLVTLPGAMADALTFLPGTGIFALLVVAASSGGTEFAWGTIVPLLARGAPRSQLVLAKAIVQVGLSVLYLAATVLLGLALGALASQLHFGSVPLDWLRDRWPALLAGLARSMMAVIPYVLAALAFALVFRSSALAMGLVFAYVIVEQVGLSVLSLLRPALEGTAYGWIVQILDWTLLGANASQLANETTRAFLPTAVNQQATPELHPWRATLVLAVYSLGFLGLALAAMRRDVGTRPTST